MGALGGCKTAAEAPTEARLLNKIGLVLCETEAKQVCQTAKTHRNTSLYQNYYTMKAVV